MKLENEAIFFKQTLCDNPFSKASELYNDASHSEKLKIQTEENRDQISCDLNGDLNLHSHLQFTTKDVNGWIRFREDSSSIDSSDNDDVKAANLESNVPECDPPELIVCFEESSCNEVEEICIDERINPSSSPVKVEDDQNDGLMKELEFTDVTMADELKISGGSLSEKDLTDRTDLNELIPVMVVEFDENEPGNDAVEEHSVEMSFEIENCSSPPSVSAREESKNVSGESTSTDPGPEDDNVTNDLSSDAKTEKESHTFDEIIILEPSKLSVVEDGPSIGESSFSSAAPLASLINYSGPVAYSGNVSIRSDSSATSTRSFAFPILQTEWHHHSPVRMAEADRRFFRKHKGWRQGLFCCRF